MDASSKRAASSLRQSQPPSQRRVATAVIASATSPASAQGSCGIGSGAGFPSVFINSRTTFWLSRSSTEPCWSNALPLRSWALPTTFRPSIIISPPTGCAKQAPESNGGVRRRSARDTGTPSILSASASIWWISIYAACRVPNREYGVATEYVSSCSCQTALPPVGRLTVSIPLAETCSASYRRVAGSCRPNDKQCGAHWYSRSQLSPCRSARCSSAWSIAILVQPGRGDSSIQRCQVEGGAAGQRGSKADPPSPSTIRFHRRAAANQGSIAVGAVDAADG